MVIYVILGKEYMLNNFNLQKKIDKRMKEDNKNIYHHNNRRIDEGDDRQLEF